MVDEANVLLVRKDVDALLGLSTQLALRTPDLSRTELSLLDGYWGASLGIMGEK